MGIISNTSEMVEFTRLYLAVFFTCVPAFYVARILSVKKNTNSEVIFIGKRFSSTWRNQTTFRIFRVSIWMLCLLRYYYPSIDDYLFIIPELESSFIILAGDILLIFGFLSVAVINMSLGSHWRSGIDPKGPRQLITTGFYQYSRNPIFLSIALGQVGFFLALPSVFSLVCLITGLFILYKQTLSEEQHLSEIFPTEYKTYSSDVCRWL